jgi:hypothetical protein
MRPGKLWKTLEPMKLYPEFRDKNHDNVKDIEVGTIFMVLSVKPDESFGSLPQYYDLHRPWLVLIGKTPGFIDILGKRILDVTPFPKEENATLD